MKIILIALIVSVLCGNVRAQTDTNELSRLLSAGVSLQKLASSNQEFDDLVVFGLTERIYLSALAIDSANTQANYNLGTTYYNRAVDLTKIIKSDVVLEEQNRDSLLVEIESLMVQAKKYFDNYEKLKK